MKRTENWYRKEMLYNNDNNKIIITGVDDKIYTYTELNGKKYEKLTIIKQPKTKDPDVVLEKSINDYLYNTATWMAKKGFVINGRDLDLHHIKTNQTINGMSLGAHFEMILEEEV